MSEIRDKVKREIGQAIIVGFLDYCNVDALRLYEFIENKILSIPELAIVNREAKVPQRKVLGSKDNAYRDTYMQGEIDAQQDMLKGHWVKEVIDKPLGK